MTAVNKTIFRKRLLKWWEDNKRDFSWRRTVDPYRILIAEMLLRKTTARQVEEIYDIFIDEYPTLLSLSNANLGKIRNLLRPLGMENQRAQLFIKLAKILMEKHDGIIPTKVTELLQLPGIGRYTANAILSFAHNKNVPMVDRNFIRIIKRVFDFRSTKSRAHVDPKTWEFAQTLILRRKAKIFNLAVLDFAAVICRARNPKCEICSLSSICVFRENAKTT